MSDALDVLGLPADCDERAIKRAYARLVRLHRPDEDPQGFRRVHDAYQAALARCTARAQAFPDVFARQASGYVAEPTRQEATAPDPRSADTDADADVDADVDAELEAEADVRQDAAEDAGAQADTEAAVRARAAADADAQLARAAASDARQARAAAEEAHVTALASRVADADAGARASSLDDLLAWAGTPGMWDAELVAGVMKRLGRTGRPALDRALATAEGALVPRFMEARAAELRAIAAARSAIPLAQAWARRLARPRADEESGLPSLHLAIAVAIEDRALAGTLSAHATDLLEEAWYPQEFGELQRRLLLSLEIEQLPGDLRTPLRRILAGLRPQLSGRDRQRILLHLGRMPHSAVMTHLQTENTAAWTDLHKRGTGAVIGIAAVIVLVVVASIGMLATGHSPIVMVLLGFWILRVMRGGSIGLTTSIGAHPAGWLTGLTCIGALIAFTSPWNLGVAGAAIVIYAITRLVPSLRRLLIAHLFVHARTQADLRLLLVAAGVALALTHLVARWPQLAAAPSAPFGGALLATAAFLLMAMFASSRPRGWARVLTAAEAPLEPRPLAIYGLLAAGTLVVIWIAASLPGWWSWLGDLALVPALIAVHHGTVAAWRQQWHVRFRVMLYALGIVAAASALIWLTAVVAASARNAPPRAHQQAPMRVKVGQELPRVEVFYAQAIAASLKKDWEAHHPERVRLRLASVINPRSNRSDENAWSIADKLLSDRSLPEGLAMLCLDRLDVLTADRARARIVHAMQDPRPAIAEHARSLEAAHDARSAPAVPEMPPAVPRPEPARTTEPESRMPP